MRQISAPGWLFRGRLAGVSVKFLSPVDLIGRGDDFLRLCIGCYPANRGEKTTKIRHSSYFWKSTSFKLLNLLIILTWHVIGMYFQV